MLGLAIFTLTLKGRIVVLKDVVVEKLVGVGVMVSLMMMLMLLLLALTVRNAGGEMDGLFRCLFLFLFLFLPFFFLGRRMVRAVSIVLFVAVVVIPHKGAGHRDWGF